MRYGYFDDAAREYVITNPRTPVKWINYVGTLAFGGFLDHTGGSQLCKGDPALNRITKYIPQLPAGDFKGETAYARVRTPGQSAAAAEVVSPYWVPCLGNIDKFECHVGMYYTRWITEMAGLRFEVLAFVPRDEDVLVRQYRVTNLREEPVAVELVPVVEFSHFDALKQLTNADWVPQTMTSVGVKLGDGRTAVAQYAFMKREMAVNVLTANRPAASFETDRKRFLGDNEYGTWANPLSLKEEALSSRDAHRGDNIAALLLPLGTLAAGESATVVTTLFQTGAITEVPGACGRYTTDTEVAAAFGGSRPTGQLPVRDPGGNAGRGFNSMINLHNPRQCYTTKPGRATCRCTSWATGRIAASGSATPRRTAWASSRRFRTRRAR
jgi:cellobiose phosphorylase